MLIDSHCHIDFPQFKDRSVEDILQKARENGVGKIINIGCSMECSENSVDLANRFEEIYAVVGIHPSDTKNLPKDYLEQLKNLLRKSKKVVAIGEVGLDYYRNSNKEEQKEVFETMLQLSFEVGLPIVLHVREAYEDVLEILRKNSKKYRGIVHCFTEDYETAEKFMELGFIFSFNGILTFPNAQKVQDTARRLPLEKIVLETDAPFLAPVPYRGKTNEPAYVKFVAEKLAELRVESVEKIEDITTRNVLELFSC